MTIVRNADGTLIVPVREDRRHDVDEDAVATSASADGHSGKDGADNDDEHNEEATAPAVRLLHPGEGGYDGALAEWDLQQNPDRPPVVSTQHGREEAMTLVHEVALSPGHAVGPAVAELDDAEATGEALRHVLIGGVHSVEDFAAEIAAAEGDDPLPAHQATKIIGEVLAELD